MDFVLDSELLIPEVEKYPCIWDSTRADYLDRDVKARAWHNIAMALNSDLTDYEMIEFIKEVQKRWKCVRDACLKSVKRSKIEHLVVGNKPRKRKPYVYMKQLRFILPFLEQQKTSTDNSEDSSMVHPTESNEDSASGNEELILSLPTMSTRKQKHCQDSSSDNSTQQTTVFPTTRIAVSEPMHPSSDCCPKSNQNFKKRCTTMSLPDETPQPLNLRKNGYSCLPYPPRGSAFPQGRFDLLGRNWSEKMKTLTNEQRIFAEKLINDVFYEAELGRLGRGCHVVVSSSSS